jgi:hypothetical protein
MMNDAALPTLCDAFRDLAIRTFEHLGCAKSVGHQPLEETLTDINLLGLKLHQSQNIIVHSFSKPAEGRNGADWEWWLTNAAANQWLGFRVQAKVLDLKTDTFKHLHFRSGRGKKLYQLEKLKNQSNANRMIPLYCFYAHTPGPSNIVDQVTEKFTRETALRGCSLATLESVEHLQHQNKSNKLEAVMGISEPWHRLVCDERQKGLDLPSRALVFLESQLVDRDRNVSPPPSMKKEFLRDAVPTYVQEILDKSDDREKSNLADSSISKKNKNLSGVLIIRGNE